MAMIPIDQSLILMADDDPDDRLLVKDALAACHPDCHIDEVLFCVPDGEALMDYLLRRGSHGDPKRSPRPDLILLDLNMPRKDGREALREIRAHPELRHIPVVVFTTSRADTDIALIYSLGANSFLTKPVAYSALVDALSILTQYWLGIVELPSNLRMRT